MRPPFLWVISRYAESFGCTPPRALWELQHDPDQMGLQILELRAYADARRAFRACKDGTEVTKAIERNPMVNLVIDIEHEIAAEQHQRLTAAAIARAMAEDV